MPINFFVISLVKAGVVAFVLMTTLAYLQWIERKVIAHIQLRVGPRRVVFLAGRPLAGAASHRALVLPCPLVPQHARRHGRDGIAQGQSARRNS